VCQRRGLREGQGVLIPAENVPHLMLEERVRAAIMRGQFAIYPVRTVDQAMSLLMGADAGTADTDGCYPPASINGRIQLALEDMARRRQDYSKGPGDGPSEEE